jgi:hypothetical protein
VQATLVSSELAGDARCIDSRQAKQTTNETKRNETFEAISSLHESDQGTDTVYTNRQRVPDDTMTGRGNRMSDKFRRECSGSWARTAVGRKAPTSFCRCGCGCRCRQMEPSIDGLRKAETTIRLDARLVTWFRHTYSRVPSHVTLIVSFANNRPHNWTQSTPAAWSCFQGPEESG